MTDVWAKTQEEPSALRDKPELHSYMGEYYRAFKLLSTRRQSSGFGGMGPISLLEMQAYAEMFEVEDLEEFVAVMCLADVVYLKHVADKAKKADDGRSGKDATS